MNKSLLSISIVFTLGSVGCAGLGMQHGSSFVPQYRADRGMDELWWTAQSTPSEGLEPPIYAEQELNALWDSSEHAPALPVESSQRGGASSDLWNPASSRGWQVTGERSSGGYELSRSSQALWH